MTGLLDAIRAEGIGVASDLGEEYLDAVMRQLNRAVCFDIRNVAAYFFEQRDWMDWRITDFPQPVPPFDVMWMEFGGGPLRQVKAASTLDRLGLLVAAKDAQSEDAPSSASLEPFRRAGFDVERIRWVVIALMVIQSRHRRAHLVGQVQYAVDPDGSVLRGDPGPILFLGLTPGWEQEPYQDRIGMAASMGRFTMYPAMLAMSFCHCKNVRIADAAPPPPKLARKFEKRHGSPPVTFRVLEIDPMREVLRREGQSEQTGLRRALHICRGHFATYSEERPLFGKVAGQFWIPSHVRGTADEGIVQKQYAVKGGSS